MRPAIVCVCSQVTGFDHFGARHHSPHQGRFTAPDELFADQHEGDPQSWNLYSYVRNNPLRYTDPTGRKCVDLDGGGQGDDGLPGPGCPASADLDTRHDTTVTAQGGNRLVAFGLNVLFALDAAASAYFDPLVRHMGGRPSYMQDIPTYREFTGQLAAGTVFVGTTFGGGGARSI